jgi:hypothetical protein
MCPLSKKKWIVDALCLLFEIAEEDNLLTRFTTRLAIPQCPLIYVDNVILFIKAFTNDANKTIFVLEFFRGASGRVMVLPPEPATPQGGRHVGY